LIQDDYILRIYRDRQNRRMVLGTVERVDGKLKSRLPRFTVFMDIEELRSILGIAHGQIPRLEQILDNTPTPRRRANPP
jgi:hypothetical protein